MKQFLMWNLSRLWMMEKVDLTLTSSPATKIHRNLRINEDHLLRCVLYRLMLWRNFMQIQ